MFLTLLSDALKKDEERPMQLPGVDDACETGKPQEDSSPKRPNLPEPSPEKLPNVAFWRPKERWRKANATAWSGRRMRSRETPAGFKPRVAQPARTIPRKSAYNVAFWPPKERLWKANATAWSGRCVRNKETPAGFKPKRWPNLLEPCPKKVPRVSPSPFPLQNGWARVPYKPTFLVIFWVWEMPLAPTIL